MEFPCCVKLVYFHSAKIHIRYQSDIAVIYAAKHQHSSKSLKIKSKPLKELEKGTPHKDVASLFGETKNMLRFLVRPRTFCPLGKKRKLFQSYENRLGAKRVKPEKYEALNKALKK